MNARMEDNQKILDGVPRFKVSVKRSVMFVRFTKKEMK